jgi:enoyl-CoA hydratase
MTIRVAGEREGIVVREAIALAVEIAGKSQIAVQTQKEAVNASTLVRPFAVLFFF